MRDRPQRRLRNMREHKTKTDDKEISSDDIKWVPLAQDRHHGREIVLTEFC
jgi:hypothetical protein